MFVEVETLVFLDGSFQRLGDPGFVVIQSHADEGRGRIYILNIGQEIQLTTFAESQVVFALRHWCETENVLHTIRRWLQRRVHSKHREPPHGPLASGMTGSRSRSLARVNCFFKLGG